MSATFTPYSEAQAHRDPTDSGAYIRLRVPDGPRPDGSILVYLPNGTGLVVNSNQLLHLDTGPDCPGQSDRRGVLQARRQLPPAAMAGWAER
jgi:hypothetical protein